MSKEARALLTKQSRLNFVPTSPWRSVGWEKEGTPISLHPTLLKRLQKSVTSIAR